MNCLSRVIAWIGAVGLSCLLFGCRSWQGPGMEALEVLPFDTLRFETKLYASDSVRVRRGVSLVAPIYLSPDTGYAAASGKNFGAVFRTVDGGASWRTVGEWPDDCSHIGYREGVLYAVIRRERSAVLYRRNAGEDGWRSIAEFAGWVYRFHLFDTRRIAAVVDGTMKISNDGGSSWTDLALPGRVISADNAFFTADTAYFTCMDDGTMLFCSWNVDTERLTLMPIPYTDYIAGDGGLAAFVGSGRPEIYELRSGWLRHRSSYGWGPRIGGGHYFTRFLARCGDRVFSITGRWGQPKKVLAYSADGGSTWKTAMEHCPLGDGDSAGRFENDTLFRLERIGYYGNGVYRTFRLDLKK